MFRLASGWLLVFSLLPVVGEASNVEGSYVLVAKLGTLTGTGKLGISVAMSGDEVLVGRPPADTMSSGFTNIFSRAGTDWNFLASFETRQFAQDLHSYQGCTSIAVDGDLVAIGEPTDNSGQGVVLVYRRTGQTWESAVLKDAAGALFDNFGCAVSISEGKILVTAPNKNNVGQGYVYAFDGTAWQLESQLVPSGIPMFAGVGIAGAMDNGVVVMGAPNRGSALVFKQSGTKWVQVKELVAGDAAPGDQFGAAVAISNGTIAVGAPQHSSGEGAAYVFAGASFIAKQKLSLSGTSYFGAAVAIDGNRLAVTRLGNDTVDLFDRVDGDWFKFGIAHGDPMTNFGASIAVSGSYVVIGASEELGGRVYIVQDDVIFRSGLQ